MTQLQPIVKQVPVWLHLGIILIFIFVLSTLATAFFGGPGQGLSFDVTEDPIGPLWTW